MDVVQVLAVGNIWYQKTTITTTNICISYSYNYTLGSSVRPYLLPVPLIEALVLPIVAERANLQSLTQNMIRQQPMLAHCRPVDDDYSYSLWHLLFATFLATIEFTRFRWVKKERRVNAFPKCLCRNPPALPTTGLCSGGRHRQIYMVFLWLTRKKDDFLCRGCWVFGGVAAGSATAPRL